MKRPGLSGSKGSLDTEEREDRFARHPYVTYTILFMLVGLVVFSWFLYYKRSLVSNFDSFDQLIPWLRSLRRACKGLIKGEGVSLWSWSAILGGDVIGNMNSVYTDPFSYVAAAFPERYLDLGYGVSTYLKLYSAGALMLTFLLYHRNDPLISVAGGLSYAFSAWALTSLVQTNFDTQLVYFPMLILGVDYINDRNRYGLFFLGVALSLATSVYFAYMSAIQTILYIVCVYFTASERPSIVGFIKHFMRFFVLVLIALLVTAPIVYSLVSAILRCGKGGGVTHGLFFTPLEMLRYLPGYLTAEQYFGNYSALSVGALPLCLLPFAFFSRSDKRTKASSIMLALCLLFTLFPVFGSMFNGFSYAVGRWQYSLAFFLVWAGVQSFTVCLEDGLATPRVVVFELFVCGLLVAGVIVAGVVDAMSKRGLVVASCNLAFMATFIVLIRGIVNNESDQNEQSRKILMCTALNLALMGAIFYSPFVGSFSQFIDLGFAYGQYRYSAFRAIKDMSKLDAFRTSIVKHVNVTAPHSTNSSYHVTTNEALYHDVPSNYGFYSTYESNLYDYYRSLCNNGSTTQRVESLPVDQRSREDFLAGVKQYAVIGDSEAPYISAAYADTRDESGRGVFLSKIDTSIGYVFDKTIAKSAYESLSYADREQAIMQALVVEDDLSTSITPSEVDSLSFDARPLAFTITPGDGVEIEGETVEVYKAGSSISLSIDSSIPDGETYVLIQNLWREPQSLAGLRDDTLPENYSKLEADSFTVSHLGYVTADNFDVVVRTANVTRTFRNLSGVNNQAITDMDDYLCNVGKVEDGSISISFNTVGAYHLDKVSAYVLPQESFERQAQALSDNRVIMDTLENDRVTGTVDSDGGILYLSVVDNGGWKLFIDGKEVEPFTVDYAFMGVDIAPGVHEIELKYRPMSMVIGLPCTAAGIVSLVLYLRFSKSHYAIEAGESEQAKNGAPGRRHAGKHMLG